MSTKILKVVSMFVFVVFLVTACSTRTVRGSGDLISEAREVSNFDRVNLSGLGEVLITQSGQESLVVETDDNLMEYIMTDVRGGTLMLGIDPTKVMLIDPTQLMFTLQVKDLEGLDISGSGSIKAESIETDSLDVGVSGSGNALIDSCIAGEVAVDISGSGVVELAGEAAQQRVDISGSGKYVAGDLYSDTADVKISGSGDVTLWVDESLDARLSGSSSLNYYGQPTVNSSGSGSSTVKSLGEK